jgi:DNA-binding response OmpR family regulator
LLEDEDNERRLMRLALERSGHAVVEAGDAAAARAACGTFGAGSAAGFASGFATASALGAGAGLDLLICDIGLPDANGRDFIEWFSGAHPGVPVIAVTGESMAQVEEPIAAAWYGSGRVVGKPFDTAELTMVVTDLLHDTQRARQAAGD